MSNELTKFIGFTYTKNGVTVTDPGTSVELVSVSGDGQVGETIAASTSDTAIPLGGLTTLGECYFKNLDATNNIKIKNAVSGTVIALLKPGRSAWIPFDTTVTAPSFQASAGTPLLRYQLFPP